MDEQHLERGSPVPRVRRDDGSTQESGTRCLGGHGGVSMPLARCGTRHACAGTSASAARARAARAQRAALSRSRGSARQHGGEHPPGQQRLRRQAEHDVRLLAEQVVTPLADLVVLQPHVDGEDVEEDEQADDDAVHEARRRRPVEPGAPHVDAPRRSTG